MIRNHFTIFFLTALVANIACGPGVMSGGLNEPDLTDASDQTDADHDTNTAQIDVFDDDDALSVSDDTNIAQDDANIASASDTPVHEDDIKTPDLDDTDLPPPDETVYTLAVISDLNGSYGSTSYGSTVHSAVEWITDQVNPDIVVSTGDMVAGQKAGLDYRAMWRAFHSAVTIPITQAGIPLAVTPGNHDASGYNAFANERAIFADEWKQHRPAVNFLDDTNYPMHYAFELGPALFISLNATTVGNLNQDQHQWVANILETFQDHPVKFVYGHVPLFPVAQGRETEILKDFEFERLLNDYNVQMMISGHHHAYYPGQRGSLSLMHTACLGSGQRKLISDTKVSERSVIVIHYDATGILASEAYGGANFAKVIDRKTLPESLNSGQMLMYRDDL